MASERRDRGFTLVEVIVTLAVNSMVIGVLGTAVFLMFRSTTDSGGRLNNARSEQTIGLWLPNDLAAADAFDSQPGSEPCNGPCPPGSYPPSTNIVLVGWPRLAMSEADPSSTWVNVAYRYAGSGSSYQVLRVVCRGTATWQCSSKVVLSDVQPPPPGAPFTHGTQSPTWVIRVSEPFAPDSALVPGGSGPPAPGGQVKAAKRVVVSINGGGTGAARNGGWKDIELTMGSTNRATLEPDELSGTPNFTEIRSRCGGNIGLLVDKSYSLGDEGLAAVKEGVNKFIDAFAGTPVKLQVVSFNHLASTLGGSWGYWFDMLDEAQVQVLRNEINALSTYYGTNWEDALFRLLKTPEGTNQAVLPNKVVFFTDGVPTYDRLTINPHNGNVPANSGQPQTLYPPEKNPYLPSANHLLGIPPARNWWIFVQEAFDRAKYVADPFRNAAVQFIGVGVGPEFTRTSQWTDVGPGGVLTETPTPNSVILARLVSGNDTGVPAIEENGVFTNAAVANMYTLPSWTQFAAAMEAVALAQCGGTLTLRTLEDGEPSAWSITYQKAQVLDSGGQPLPNDGNVVTTSAEFVSGTFDLSIPGGDYVTVEIRPVLRSDLEGLSTVGWTCRARGVDRAVTTVPLAGSSLTGVRVKVSANEAVSCRAEVQGP